MDVDHSKGLMAIFTSVAVIAALGLVLVFQETTNTANAILPREKASKDQTSCGLDTDGIALIKLDAKHANMLKDQYGDVCKFNTYLNTYCCTMPGVNTVA